MIHKEWIPDERHDDWSLDEWNDDWSCVGWHEDYERMCSTSVSSFSLESSERVNANLDTGVTVDTSLANFDRKGVGDMEGSMTGSQMSKLGNFKDTMKNGKPRSLNGRLSDARQVLGSNASACATAPAALMYTKVRCSAAEIAYREQQDFYVEHDGDYIIPIHIKIGQETIIHFEKLVNENGMRLLIPAYLGKEALHVCAVS